MKRKCPQCGNIEDSKFCTNCGHSLLGSDILKICPNCGAETTSKFCTRCGTNMDSNVVKDDARRIIAEGVQGNRLKANLQLADDNSKKKRNVGGTVSIIIFFTASIIMILLAVLVLSVSGPSWLTSIVWLLTGMLINPLVIDYVKRDATNRHYPAFLILVGGFFLGLLLA